MKEYEFRYIENSDLATKVFIYVTKPVASKLDAKAEFFAAKGHFWRILSFAPVVQKD